MPALPRVYEGEEVLADLLQAAGARLDVAAVKERLSAAQAKGEEPSAVFPRLFEGEPRFPAPEVALRLYANLFGLWDRLAAGGPVEPAAAAPESEAEREPAPAPAPVGEGEWSDEFVEAAWRYLADLPERELERLEHRYENTQSELAEAVRFEAGEAPVAVETADALAFEIWAMYGLARPKAKPRQVTMAELQNARESSEVPQPALDRYLVEVVGEAELDEEEPLAPEDAKVVLDLARAVARSLEAASRG
ncbi:MAG: hypothetical protein ACOX6T_05025 [Myxococcales bacterium]